MSDQQPSFPARFPWLKALLAQGVVIVVSVLFALAVDRAVMGSDQRALERAYLAGLAADFESVQAVTASMMSTAAARDSAARTVLATVRRGTPGGLTGMELAEALELSGFIIDLPIARDTWDDMLGTGRFGILRNEEIRLLIARFYRRADELHGYAGDWVDTARPYTDAVRSMLDPEVRVAVGSELIFHEAVAGAPEPDADVLARRMVSEPRLLSGLGGVLLINKFSSQAYADLDAMARRISAMIREERGLEGS